MPMPMDIGTPRRCGLPNVRKDALAFLRSHSVPVNREGAVAGWPHQMRKEGSIQPDGIVVDMSLPSIQVPMYLGRTLSGTPVRRHSNEVNARTVKPIWRNPGRTRTMVTMSKGAGDPEIMPVENVPESVGDSPARTTRGRQFYGLSGCQNEH